jgi:divalent metal cation (Fe/Co/Zn/Cd) transporter
MPRWKRKAPPRSARCSSSPRRSSSSLRYIVVEASRALVNREEPLTSPVGIALSVLSLLIMPVLAYAKHRTGREMNSRALVADSMETWVCANLSVALLVGVGAFALFGWWWADPIGALAMLPVILWQGWETLAEAREQ